MRISAPADTRHPYGHGKAENLSALAQTVLLFATCVWVVYEGVQRLASGSSPVVPSLWGVGVMAISMAIDINRVRVLRRVAKTYNSQALEADALHFSTDILSSAVVLVGVLAVWLAQALQMPEPISRVLSQADTVAALLVAAIIFRASMHMASDAVNMLMDSGSSQASEAIVIAVRKIAGISEVTRVRVRTSGPQSFVDLTVGVAPGLKVSDSHRLAHEAEQAVAGVLPGADVTVHVEPRKSCRIDENNPFALVQVAASEHGLAVHDVHILSADSACHIELHVELPGQMPLIVPCALKLLRTPCTMPCRVLRSSAIWNPRLQVLHWSRALRFLCLFQRWPGVKSRQRWKMSLWRPCRTSFLPMCCRSRGSAFHSTAM